VGEFMTINKKIVLVPVELLISTGARSIFVDRVELKNTEVTTTVETINIWYFSNYSSEIAVNNLVCDVSRACHMKTFLDRFYAPCIISPKNRAVLESVALELSVKLKSI
jgi:hypothetical protein